MNKHKAKKVKLDATKNIYETCIDYCDPVISIENKITLIAINVKNSIKSNNNDNVQKRWVS